MVDGKWSSSKWRNQASCLEPQLTRLLLLRYRGKISRTGEGAENKLRIAPGTASSRVRENLHRGVIRTANVERKPSTSWGKTRLRASLVATGTRGKIFLREIPLCHRFRRRPDGRWSSRLEHPFGTTQAWSITPMDERDIPLKKVHFRTRSAK